MPADGAPGPRGGAAESGRINRALVQRIRTIGRDIEQSINGNLPDRYPRAGDFAIGEVLISL